MKPGPVQNADVVAGEIKALGRQRAQLAGSGGLFKRMPQLDHTTPFTRFIGRSNRRQDRLVCRYEVCVVLGGHAQKISFTSVGSP